MDLATGSTQIPVILNGHQSVAIDRNLRLTSQDPHIERLPYCITAKIQISLQPPYLVNGSRTVVYGLVPRFGPRIKQHTYFRIELTTNCVEEPTMTEVMRISGYVPRAKALPFHTC